MPDNRKKIEEREEEWKETTLKASLKGLGRDKPYTRTYTPLDLRKDWNFLDDVGFPGEYPFTRASFPTFNPPLDRGIDSGAMVSSGMRSRAGEYSGFGRAEDTRDLWRSEGRRGANLAFDLPTQCGFDSDDPFVEGEVGGTGVAIDTLQDFATLYDAFQGVVTLDQIASNWTINAPANIIIAMYVALAERQGIPIAKLRGTPQNDILKEILGRGTHIFPVDPSMRMIRDTIAFCTKSMPLFNTISIAGDHMRQAAALTQPQIIAITLSNAIAYMKLGISTGLSVDEFVPRFTFLGLGGGPEFFREIAMWRAVRRMWAKIMKERFGATNPRTMTMRSAYSARHDADYCTKQRPLNNLVRSVIGGIAGCFSGGQASGGIPFDEALGLGWSYEARQLRDDAARIMRYESHLDEVIDPLAGSYYVESLTDQIEEEAWELINKIDSLGGAVETIKSGWTQRLMARQAWERQSQIERGETIIVGVNKFTGENELEVLPKMLVPHPYNAKKREEAEELQITKLKKIKAERDNSLVSSELKKIESAARKEVENLIPCFIDAVKAQVTLGEICGVLKNVFGEYEEAGI
ncbi:MAG: methylmalonyl-CoA mutase family protein [Desulfobacteria bacterium]